MDPEFIITRSFEPKGPIPVEFESIFKSRDSVTSLMLLWDIASYHVDVLQRQFIICGGRRLISNDALSFNGKVWIFCAKRHQREVNAENVEDVKKERLFYLLGITNDTDYLYLQISEDGKQWMWRNKR